MYYNTQKKEENRIVFGHYFACFFGARAVWKNEIAQLLSFEQYSYQKLPIY
jgi:hypothetical protein